MSAGSNPVWTGKNITSTTTVKATAGQIGGIFVASSTSGTIKLQDGSATLVNTFNVSGATWYPLPFGFANSLVVTITGTLDCTVAYV